MTEKGMMKLSGEVKKFTKEEISAIKELGWKFLHSEDTWVKFDSSGCMISWYGSIAWREDLIKIGVLIR